MSAPAAHTDISEEVVKFYIEHKRLPQWATILGEDITRELIDAIPNEHGDLILELKKLCKE